MIVDRPWRDHDELVSCVGQCTQRLVKHESTTIAGRVGRFGCDDQDAHAPVARV